MRLWKGKGVQRKPLPAFAVVQVPTAQNNQCNKAAYFGVARSATFQSKPNKSLFPVLDDLPQ